MENLDALMETLTSLDVTQICELRCRLEDKWGVTSAVAAPVMPEPVPVTKVEQTEFSVFLTGYDATKKMGVIKSIRDITKFGLADSKGFVEASVNEHKEIKNGLSRVDAEEIKRLVELVGGTVEIK